MIELLEALADIPFVSIKLSLKVFQKLCQKLGVVILHIARSDFKIKNISQMIDYQMYFKSEKPSGRTLTSLCHPLKNLMCVYATIVANS